MIRKIGILAGSGGLAERVVHSCHEQKIPFHVITFYNQAVHLESELCSVSRFYLGQVGSIVKDLKQHHCTHVVMAGRIERPQSWLDVKPDFKGTMLLAKFAGKAIGDDGLFKIIIQYLEQEGFKVLGCESLIGNDSFCSEGLLTKVSPDDQAIQDIAHGANILRTLSRYDVGQSCIVQNGLVLGIEAIEGTDNLIQRCHNLHHSQLGGVLIKLLKVGQETRVDRAVIGMQTIINLSQCGFKGLAVQAEGVLILDKLNVISTANQLGLFIIGINIEFKH